MAYGTLNAPGITLMDLETAIKAALRQIPDVNDAAITIRINGKEKGSFTLNQSTDCTIEIEDENTTYTAGNGLSLSGNQFSVKTAGKTTDKNYAVATDNDGNLIVSVLWENTLNTAGAGNNDNKMFLIGAPAQNPDGTQTYSNSSVYMLNGCLYSQDRKTTSMRDVKSLLGISELRDKFETNIDHVDFKYAWLYDNLLFAEVNIPLSAIKSNPWEIRLVGVEPFVHDSTGYVVGQAHLYDGNGELPAQALFADIVAVNKESTGVDMLMLQLHFRSDTMPTEGITGTAFCHMCIPVTVR